MISYCILGGIVRLRYYLFVLAIQYSGIRYYIQYTLSIVYVSVHQSQNKRIECFNCNILCVTYTQTQQVKSATLNIIINPKKKPWICKPF